jgi:uncharacterized protein (TIGR02599 family)
MIPVPASPERRSSAFTLVEVLVSMAVIVILMLLLVQTTDAVRKTTSRTTGKIEQFREARDAFESITRRLSQATLNTYSDFNPKVTGTDATKYARASELRFISGNAETLIGGAISKPHPGHAVFFQAPFGFVNGPTYSGMAGLLNTWGFFVEWGSDQDQRPPFLPGSIPLKWRFRLMELMEPSEDLAIYKYTSGKSGSGNYSKSWDYTGKEWFQDSLARTDPVRVRPIAENIILLGLLPMVAPRDAEQPHGGAEDGTSTDIAPNYSYDSSVVGSASISSLNQLPPLVQVFMIAVEEKSFARYLDAHGGGEGGMPELGLNGILTDATFTTRKADIERVVKTLQDNKIDYRMFSSAVPLVTKGPAN